MFKQISELEDTSAAGIARAADEEVIESNVINEPVIQEARQKVQEGKGEWTYDIGSNRVWRPPK